MQLLPRYAQSLEAQRTMLIESYEQFIDACLMTSHWLPVIWRGQLPDGREIRVEPFGTLFKADIIVDDRRWRYDTHVQALIAALTYRGYASDPPGKCRRIS